MLNDDGTVVVWPVAHGPVMIPIVGGSSLVNRLHHPCGGCSLCWCLCSPFDCLLFVWNEFVRPASSGASATTSTAPRIGSAGAVAVPPGGGGSGPSSGAHHHLGRTRPLPFAVSKLSRSNHNITMCNGNFDRRSNRTMSGRNGGIFIDFTLPNRDTIIGLAGDQADFRRNSTVDVATGPGPRHMMPPYPRFNIYNNYGLRR